MGWLSAMAVLCLLLVLPLGMSAIYDEDGGRISLIAGFLRFPVYPSNKSKKNTKKATEQIKTENIAKPKSNKNAGPISDFYPFITLVLDFLCDFRRKLRVDMFMLHITLAGGDPADLAQNYGKTWAAVGSFWPAFNRFLVIKKQDVNIQCDFEGNKTIISARLDLTLTVGRLLFMVIRHGTKGLKEFFRFRKKRNGGII